MRLKIRLMKLEDEYAIVDLPVERIYQAESLVRLRSGREMTYEEYQRQVASGEIRKFSPEDLVEKMVFKNIITLINGSCKDVELIKGIQPEAQLNAPSCTLNQRPAHNRFAIRQSDNIYRKTAMLSKFALHKGSVAEHSVRVAKHPVRTSTTV